MAAAGGALVLALSLAPEWGQRRIPGRIPDATDALVPLLVWSVPWFVGDARPEAGSGRAPVGSGGSP